jgi:hypothetical protein
MMRALLFCLGLALSLPAWCTTYYMHYTQTTGANDGTAPESAWQGWGSINWTTLTTGLPNTLCISGTDNASRAVGGQGTGAAAVLTLKWNCSNVDRGYIELSAVATCLTTLTTRSYTRLEGLNARGFTGTCADFRSATGGQVVDAYFRGVRGFSDVALIAGNNAGTYQGIVIENAGAGISTRGCVNCAFDDILIRDGGVWGTGANLDGFGLDDSGGTGCEGTTVNNLRVYRQGSNQGSGVDFQCSAGTGTVRITRLVSIGNEGVGVTVGSLATLAHVINGAVSALNGLNAWYQKTTGTPATYYGIVGAQAVGNQNSAFRFGDGSSTGMTATIRNSIFVGDNQTLSFTTTSGTIADSHNDYFGPLHDTSNGSRTLAQWISDGRCAAGGCLDVEPKFVGGRTGETREAYKLRCDSSSLVKAGLDVGAYTDNGGRTMNAGKPTMGAWECAVRDTAPNRSVR